MNRMRAAPRRAARVRCIHSKLMMTYTPRRMRAAIQKAGVTARVRGKFWAASKRWFPWLSTPGGHYLYRGRLHRLPVRFLGLNFHLGGRQGPRRQLELGGKSALAAGGDLLVLAQRLDGLAVHQDLDLHLFYRLFLLGVLDYPGHGEAVRRGGPRPGK